MIRKIQWISVMCLALAAECGIAGQPDQARNVLFNFTGALTGNIIVFWPNALPRNFRVNNATSGAFTLTVAVNNGSGSPAGATYAVPQGLVSALASDGNSLISSNTPKSCGASGGCGGGLGAGPPWR